MVVWPPMSCFFRIACMVRSVFAFRRIHCVMCLVPLLCEFRLVCWIWHAALNVIGLTRCPKKVVVERLPQVEPCCVSVYLRGFRCIGWSIICVPVLSERRWFFGSRCLQLNGGALVVLCWKRSVGAGSIIVGGGLNRTCAIHIVFGCGMCVEGAEGYQMCWAVQGVDWGRERWFVGYSGRY